MGWDEWLGHIRVEPGFLLCNLWELYFPEGEGLAVGDHQDPYVRDR